MFTRQSHNSSYIAYAAQPSKKPQPLIVDGKQITARIHPDVFINEYVSICVKDVADNGDTVNIKFDAASAVTSGDKKMKYDFGSNVKSGSDLHRLAVEAKNTGRAVYLALETRRRYKTRNGEIIPLATPIHLLRGCKDGPQSAGNSNMTGDNCSKIIAAMGWADQPDVTLISEECHANPLHWDQIRYNQGGDIAPDGFIFPTLPAGSTLPDGTALPDGTRAGGIITAPTPTGGTDTTGLMKELATLKKMVAHLQTGSSNASGSKPWCDRLPNGEINPGSYELTQIRHTRETATRLITQAVATTDVDYPAEELRELESSLTRVLLWLADGVQAQVTGGSNRMGKSYTEAGAWVKHVIACEDPYTADLIGPDNKEQAQEWAKRVRTAAAERYLEAVALAGENTATSTPVPQNPPAQAAEPTENSTDDIPEFFAQDQQARQLWDQLISDIGMVNNLADLNPALTARFGTYLSNQIPAIKMREALSEWVANPSQFHAWAGEQWAKANQVAQG